MVGSDEQARQRTGWSGGGRRAGIALIGAAVLALGAAALATGATSKGYGTSLGSFKTHNLVSDQAGKADVMDKSLVNAWGLSFGTKPATPAWIADNGTDVSTLYQGDVGLDPGEQGPADGQDPRRRADRNRLQRLEVVRRQGRHEARAGELPVLLGSRKDHGLEPGRAAADDGPDRCLGP